MSFHQEDEELSQSIAQLLTEDDASFYIPEDTSSSGEWSDSGYQCKLGEQRTKLNEFLSTCNTGITVSTNKNKWQDASVRTRTTHVSKARESVVAALNVIASGDAGHL